MINQNHTKRIMIIAVLFALIALTGIASANINYFNIQVSDSSYNPISGATITLTAPGYATYTRTTGSDGKPTTPFSGYNLASPTTVSITITKTGYTSYTSSTDTFMEKGSTPGYTYTYNYPLSAPTTTAITITVQDSVNHANIPGATVSISNANPTSQITDNIGKTGSFIVPLSGFTTQISKSGYQGYTATDAVSYMSSPQSLVYYIVANVAPTPTPEPQHAIVTFTTYTGGSRLGGATIVIRDNNNNVVGSGTTLNTGELPGSFSHYFTPIPSSYSVVVSKSGYSDYTHTYTSAPTDNSDVSISLTEYTPPSGGDYENFIATMSSNSAPSGYSATTSSSQTSYEPYRAFDHQIVGDNNWWTNGQSTGWIAIQTPTGHIAQNYTISTAGTGNSVLVDRAPHEWTFKGSNDGDTWTTLDTRHGTFWSTSIQDVSFEFSNTNSYTMYKLLVTANNGDSTLGFSELQITEDASTPPPTPTPTPVPTPSLTSIQVQVQDSVNHANVPGALVSIPSASPTSLITDNTGKTTTFQVSTSSSGYAINISVSGYANYGVTEHVSYSGTTQTLVYYIVANVAPTPTPEPQHALVSYNIYDGGTATGIPGATVTIRDNTNAVVGGGTTVTGGTTPGGFIQYFTPIPPSYSISVTKSGYTDYTFTYNNPPVDNSIQNIFLSPAVLILNLDVKSASTGYLIQGASVGIYDPNHDVWRNGTASTGMVYFDSTGENFEYPLTIGKNVTIAAWADGYQYHARNHTITQPNYLLTLNLAPDNTLPTGDEYTIVFTVLSNYNQQPIKDITVTSGLGAIKLTNSAGAATFQNVPAGVTTMFDFSGTGYLGASISSTGSAGQVIMRQVELVQTGATPTPTPIGGSSVNTSVNTDLNIKGQTFLTNWADTAINMGELIFFLLFIFFAKKILS